MGNELCFNGWDKGCFQFRENGDGMEQFGAWIGLGLLLLAGYVLRQRHKRTGPLGKALSRLRELTRRVREGESASTDLAEWEDNLRTLEGYPNNYNELNMEIQFMVAFRKFLEQHAPEDARIETLLEIERHRKDTILGFNIHLDK